MKEAADPHSQRESRRERLMRLLSLCEERLGTHPADLDGLLEISAALWDMGCRPEALEYSRKILTRHPGHPKVREVIQRYVNEMSGTGRTDRGRREEGA